MRYLATSSDGESGEARAAGLTAERTWQTAQSDNPADRCYDVEVAGLRAQVKLAADGFNLNGLTGFFSLPWAA